VTLADRSRTEASFGELDTLPALWVNGVRVSPADPQISALDRGFTLADGVFETMRSYGGVIFRLGQHLERLEHGMRVLAIRPSSRVEATIADAMRKLGKRDAIVRVTVSRGVGPPGIALPAGSEATVVVAVHPLAELPRSIYTRGVTALIASGRRNQHAMTAGLKSLSFTDSIAALAQAHAGGADDALFLDTADRVSEATSSNVFVCKNGSVATPSLDCGALPGITRATVLELTQELDIAAEERVVTLEELFNADEVFLTSSVREIVPLIAVDGRPVGDARPGPVTRRLCNAYGAIVRLECV
jgi:branched-chain amino acid aminotransferase